MTLSNLRNALLAICVSGLTSLPAMADESASTDGAKSDDDWEFAFAPLFLWGVSLKGDSTVAGQTAPLDISFTDDVLENLAAVITLHFEGRKGRAGFFVEYQYIDLEPSAQVKNGPTVDVSVINQLAELGGTYTLWGHGRRRFEALGGVRWYDVDLKVKLDNGVRIGESDEKWLDGFVGGRLWWDLSPKWTFIGRADIGAGDSDFVWNVAATFDYRYSDLLSMFVGYRILDDDYSTGSGSNKFSWDVREQGPLAGLEFHW